jgi:hypothetical protein
MEMGSTEVVPRGTSPTATRPVLISNGVSPASTSTETPRAVVTRSSYCDGPPRRSWPSFETTRSMSVCVPGSTSVVEVYTSMAGRPMTVPDED